MWWWRSYNRGGSLAIYVLIYSVGFLFNTLHHLSGMLPIVLYISYMSLLVWCIYLAMGTLGFLSSFAFTYAIFNAAKSVSRGERVSGGGCRGWGGVGWRGPRKLRVCARACWLGGLAGWRACRSRGALRGADAWLPPLWLHARRTEHARHVRSRTAGCPSRVPGRSWLRVFPFPRSHLWHT